MGEKERAEALLQAAGVTGVAVQSAEETVTMSKREADELRAGAAGPTPGQIYAQQQQAAAQAAEQLPEGILTEAQTNAELDRIESLPVPEQNRMNKDAVMASYEYHARGGR